MNTPRSCAVSACAILLAAASTLSAQARAVIPPPHFERTVKPGAPGPNRLTVDLPLLVGGSSFDITRDGDGSGLGELRFHDATGRETMYLLVWPSTDDPIWRASRIVRVAPGKDTSGFEADLGAVTTVDRIEVLRLPGRFLKRVRVEGSGDRVRWTMLVPEGTLFNLDAPLRQTQLAFEPGSYRYLRVIWDDHAGGQIPGNVGARARVAPRGTPPADTLRAALPLEKRAGVRRTSRYHLKLPASRLPIVAIDLDVRDPLVLRDALVTEPQTSAQGLAPRQLGTATLRRTTSGDAVASRLRVPIAMPAGTDVDLVVDDGDNAPLDLRGATAVFAPLPYIYFVSPDGGELRATYGTGRRTVVPPPSYDLAVLRDTVKRIATALATWSAPRALLESAKDSSAPATLYSAPGAALDASTFRYAREIPSGSGLAALRLDAAALAHSRIADIRIVDSVGRQVPYLLERLEEVTELPLGDIVPTKARDNAALRSWYQLRLPYSGLPEATLRLETSARVFAREIDVLMRQLSRDQEPDAAFTRTVGAVWAHDDPDAAAPPLEISMGQRLPTDSLFVAVNDGDNQKLPLTRATLLLPTYRLLFFRQPGASLTLLYGRNDLAAPSYDLGILRDRLLDAPAQDVVAAPESAHVNAKTNTPKLLFWSVLGVAVVTLLAIIARLVRGGPMSEENDVKG